eukprot:5781107-Pleurochrysis_carterae.AAC.4
MVQFPWQASTAISPGYHLMLASFNVIIILCTEFRYNYNDLHLHLHLKTRYVSPTRNEPCDRLIVDFRELKPRFARLTEVRSCRENLPDSTFRAWGDNISRCRFAVVRSMNRRTECDSAYSTVASEKSCFGV